MIIRDFFASYLYTTDNELTDKNPFRQVPLPQKIIFYHILFCVFLCDNYFLRKWNKRNLTLPTFIYYYK